MKKLFILSIVVMMLFTACTGTPQLEITDPSRNIEATAGSEFQIVIESNPTTGYHWEIVGELDDGLVDFVSKDYQSTSDPGLVGGGGVDIFTFKALSPGDTTIVLGSYPPSNDPVEPASTVSFTVSVK